MGEVPLILQDQIRRYGGAYGVRDHDLLSSALAMPSTTFEGKYLHKDLFDQAAAYAFHLCQNHPRWEQENGIGFCIGVSLSERDRTRRSE